MAFLPKFNDPSYTNANVNRFDVRQPQPQLPPDTWKITHNPAVEAAWGGGMGGGRGIGSQGVMDQVARGGSRGGGGGGGGNADGSPNVVYDQQPEQFARQMKLREKEFEAEGARRGSELEVERIKAQAAMKNAEAMANYRGVQGENAAEANAIRRWKAMNPNLILSDDIRGGNLVAFDPATGQMIDTGLSNGTMAEGARIDKEQGGRMAVVGAQGQNAREVAGLNNASALERAILNANASAQRQDDEQAARQATEVFKTDSGIWTNRIKESLENPNIPPPLGPVERPPKMGAINSLAPIVLDPKQTDSFKSQPGQFNAAPGQFIAGTAAGDIAAQGGNPAQLRSQAEEYLKTTLKKSNPSEEQIAYVMKQLMAAQKGGGTAAPAGPAKAGQVSGTPAGKTTGPAAGTITPR